jgi:hypothetical protein
MCASYCRITHLVDGLDLSLGSGRVGRWGVCCYTLSCTAVTLRLRSFSHHLHQFIITFSRRVVFRPGVMKSFALLHWPRVCWRTATFYTCEQVRSIGEQLRSNVCEQQRSIGEQLRSISRGLIQTNTVHWFCDAQSDYRFSFHRKYISPLYEYVVSQVWLTACLEAYNATRDTAT